MKVMDFVLVTIENKRLNISSGTAKRINQGLKPTIQLVEGYQKKYPDFSVVVNDSYLKWYFTKVLHLPVPLK